MLSLPPSFFSVCFSVLCFLSRTFFLCLFYRCYGCLWLYSSPSSFSLHFHACRSHLFWWLHLSLMYVHIDITHLDLFFELHTQLSTRQLSLNSQRHIRYNVKNGTNHISTQMCVFVVKSMLLLSIKWPSQKLENILDFFLSTCHQNQLIVPYITGLPSCLRHDYCLKCRPSSFLA